MRNAGRQCVLTRLERNAKRTVGGGQRYQVCGEERSAVAGRASLLFEGGGETGQRKQKKHGSRASQTPEAKRIMGDSKSWMHHSRLPS